MPFHLSTHASLLARLGNDGDDEAWREFHDRYYSLIHRFARARGLPPIDADDVAQEVLMVVHEKIREFRYDPERGRFRGYLKTLALRTVWRHQEKPAADDEAALATLADDPELEAQWESEWRRYHLSLAMGHVRQEFVAEEVEAFEEMTVGGRSVNETAEATGIPASRLYRVRAAILERLQGLITAQVAEEG